MPIDQHGDSFGDRSGQVPKVKGDRGGCVVIHPLAHTCRDRALASEPLPMTRHHPTTHTEKGGLG